MGRSSKDREARALSLLRSASPTKSADASSSPPPPPMPRLARTGQVLRGIRGNTDADAAVDSGSLVEQLTQALATQISRIVDLFREWDDDASGTVSRLEFRRALPMLGFKVERQVAEDLFASFDEDASGEISYDELRDKLRAQMIESAGIDLDERLKAGAMGEITMESKNKIALRGGILAEGVSGTFGAKTKLLTGEGAPSVVEQLRSALDKHLARVIDLFREWDDDGNGVVSKLEFRQALPVLGLDIARSDADDLFDSIDRDGSGTIDYRELSKQLRPQVKVSSLPKVKSAPRLGLLKQAASSPDRSGAQEYKNAVAAELAAKKRLAKIQKELLRAASMSALQDQREQKRLAAQRSRQELNQLVGRDLTAALQSDQTLPASEDEVRDLAERFHKQMQIIFADPAERTWFKLYHYMDEDKNGRISFSEFRTILRSHLKLDKVHLPENKLKSLWKVLDEDGSGYLEAGDFARFMRKGTKANKKTDARQIMIAKRAESRAALKAELMEERIDMEPTLMSKLAATPCASEEEVCALAEELTSKMTTLFPRGERAWFKLFKLVDEDKNGQISFKEYLVMVRSHLGKSKREVPDSRLRAVWKVIDEDANGAIDVGEFGRFMKRGAARLADKEDESSRRRRAAKEERVARQLAAQEAEDERLRAASRRMAAMTRQIEMDAARLEAQMQAQLGHQTQTGPMKKRVELRRNAPTIAFKGAASDKPTEGASANIQTSTTAPSTMFPPLRIGPGVDF